MSYNKGYAVLIARTIDILCCAWVWRDYDVTISSMVGLELRKPAPRWWARWLGKFLNWIEKNHTELAILADIERARQALTILGAKT